MPKAGKDSQKDYLRYKRYYIGRETSEAGKDKRVARDQARTKAIKAGIISGPDDPREVDHKRPMSKGGSNRLSNLQALTRRANRSKFT